MNISPFSIYSCCDRVKRLLRGISPSAITGHPACQSMATPAPVSSAHARLLASISIQKPSSGTLMSVSKPGAVKAKREPAAGPEEPALQRSPSKLAPMTSPAPSPGQLVSSVNQKDGATVETSPSALPPSSPVKQRQPSGSKPFSQPTPAPSPAPLPTPIKSSSTKTPERPRSASAAPKRATIRSDFDLVGTSTEEGDGEASSTGDPRVAIYHSSKGAVLSATATAMDAQRSAEGEASRNGFLHEFTRRLVAFRLRYRLLPISTVADLQLFMQARTMWSYAMSL